MAVLVVLDGGCGGFKEDIGPKAANINYQINLAHFKSVLFIA